MRFNALQTGRISGATRDRGLAALTALNPSGSVREGNACVRGTVPEHGLPPAMGPASEGKNRTRHSHLQEHTSNRGGEKCDVPK